MEIKYIWMEVSTDGLLKLPKDVGPYYSTDNVNPAYGGYESESDAISALEEFHRVHKYECAELILVKKYCRS